MNVEMKMTKMVGLIIVVVFVALLLLVVIISQYNRNNSSFTKSEAINILKTKYPEFKDYPSDNLPPKRIIAERDTDGWYITFLQLGSGRPILGAKCFLVKNDKSVVKIGEFNPDINNTVLDISPRTCR